MKSLILDTNNEHRLSMCFGSTNIYTIHVHELHRLKDIYKSDLFNLRPPSSTRISRYFVYICSYFKPLVIHGDACLVTDLLYHLRQVSAPVLITRNR